MHILKRIEGLSIISLSRIIACNKTCTNCAGCDVVAESAPALGVVLVLACRDAALPPLGGVIIIAPRDDAGVSVFMLDIPPPAWSWAQIYDDASSPVRVEAGSSKV